MDEDGARPTQTNEGGLPEAPTGKARRYVANVIGLAGLFHLSIGGLSFAISWFMQETGENDGVRDLIQGVVHFYPSVGLSYAIYGYALLGIGCVLHFLGNVVRGKSTSDSKPTGVGGWLGLMIGFLFYSSVFCIINIVRALGIFKSNSSVLESSLTELSAFSRTHVGIETGAMAVLAILSTVGAILLARGQRAGIWLTDAALMAWAVIPIGLAALHLERQNSTQDITRLVLQFSVPALAGLLFLKRSVRVAHTYH